MSQTSKELGAARSSRDAAEDAAPMGFTPLENALLHALASIAAGATFNAAATGSPVERRCWNACAETARAAIAKAEEAS